MILKQVSECEPDGSVRTSALLIENCDNGSSSASDKILCKLGSLNDEGLDNVIELSNSINKFLFESVVDYGRDGIQSSQSYGMVYLISQILKEYGISSEMLFGSDNKIESNQRFEFLQSLVACLLDYQSTEDSSLDGLQKRIYFQKDLILNQNSISDLTSAIQQYPLLENNSTDHSCFSNKLTAWLSGESESWSVVNDFDSISFIAGLADFVYQKVEEMSALSWDSICENLTELCAVRVESGSETFLLTTRPSSSHLKLFYRLGIELPPHVICESREKTPETIEVKKEKMDLEHILAAC